MSNFHSVPNTPPPFLFFDHSPREQSPSHHILIEEGYYRSPPSSTSLANNNFKQQMIGANSFQPISLERSSSSSSIGNSSISSNYSFSPLPFSSLPQPQSSQQHYFYSTNNSNNNINSNSNHHQHQQQQHSIKTSHPIPLKASPRASIVNSTSSINSYHRQSSTSSPIPNPIINSTPFVKLNINNNNNNTNNNNSNNNNNNSNINLVSPTMSPHNSSYNNCNSSSPSQLPMSPVFERALIPLLNLKQCKPDFDSTFTISPKYSSSVPSTPGETTPTSASSRTPQKSMAEASPTILSPSSSCSSLPESPRNTGSGCSSYPSSPSSTPCSTPRGATNDRNGEPQYPKQAEQQWKKLEYYANEFNHFIFETLKTKEFSQIETLNAKLSEITNTVKEIEITNNIYKSLPPQTRARKKRATKAEKLQKDLLGIKRTYVTTPKSKGNYCFFCGTMETPEWRKGPGGHKTLCNACGLHYAKNIKKESVKNSQQNPSESTSCQSMNRKTTTTTIRDVLTSSSSSKYLILLLLLFYQKVESSPKLKINYPINQSKS
ncbi:putative GATA-binding transcription factor [Heterostelium album PN500]|uniref:Putative GATA-binding transcription factor n=1 Tax=Heterostelium pallidum (strain ATCC 26659 / Pp 5 / PN500) TaxID=670386 RepID=D3BCC5_HETP5|nr:putative GATA-binding transcription factor [Heterostelium album PN500]EFA80915.1 putative GATA-binding transcription factor [Heterostelium album PN500]|eukprot:XP_020433033.1 putative GATA-binding transcription factor [Heterostelium album PN500]